jgi:hypothetical protein
MENPHLIIEVDICDKGLVFETSQLSADIFMCLSHPSPVTKGNILTWVHGLDLGTACGHATAEVVGLWLLTAVPEVCVWTSDALSSNTVMAMPNLNLSL